MEACVALCRRGWCYCCCYCCEDDDVDGEDESKRQTCGRFRNKESIYYARQNIEDGKNPTDAGPETESIDAKTSLGSAKGDGEANGNSTGTGNNNGNSSGGGEEQHLLKETRSSSLKTEQYRQIWQRRSVWIRQKTIHSFDFRPVEFWSGWTQRQSANQQAAQAPNATSPSPSATTVTSQSRRKALNLTHGLSVESLQPELYTQTSTESVPEESVDGCETEAEASLSGTSGSGPAPLGEIHFSVVYDFAKKNLVVKVIEARQLPTPASKSTSHQPTANGSRKSTPLSRSNPYVKVCLLPNQHESRQTMVHGKTQSPVFDEVFVFDVAYREALRRTLLLKVKDFDKYTRHHVIGQVLLALSDQNIAKGIDTWKRIRPSDQDLPELGEILLSLTYLPSAGRLNLDVLRAKQLLQTDIVGGAVPYVRVSLVVAGKHIKTKKTSSKRNTIDPVWGETVSFNVAAAEFAEVSLVVSVWDFNGGILKDDFIGRIVLGKYATGTQEITHWSAMLEAERSSVAQWQVLRSREECDQISSASAAVP